MVIAYGPPAAKAPAVVHLFHYWPQMDPSLTDKRGIHFKFTGIVYLIITYIGRR